MLSDEEKKAIEQFNNFIFTYQDVIEDEYSDYEEKEQEDNRKDLYNAINNLCFKEIDKISDRIYVNMSIRDILQSLLEKE